MTLGEDGAERADVNFPVDERQHGEADEDRNEAFHAKERDRRTTKQGRGSAGMGPCTSAGGESRLGRGAGQAAAQEVKGYRQQKKYHRPYGQEEARVGPADEEYATQVARGHYEPHPGGAAVGGRGQREHAAGQQQPPE